MKALQALPEQVDYFDETAWHALCDYVTIYSKDDVRVTFTMGRKFRFEIACNSERNVI